MSEYELTAESSGYFYLRKGGSPITPPHFHGAIELMFCAEGRQEVSIGGETKVLTKGDACFVNGYTVHSLSVSDANLYIFVADKQYFSPIFHSFKNALPPTFFRFENYPLLEFLYVICEENAQNPLGRYEANEGALKILMAEIAKTTPLEKRKNNRQSDLVCEILRYASEHLTEELSLKILAEKFGYSHEHLSRVLHRHLGEHWNRYLGRLRVREAAATLKKHPELSVLEIALRCGFDSPNTFYRAYLREYGVPPRQKTQLLT